MYRLTASELLKNIEASEISLPEIADCFLNRIKKINQKYNCWTSTNPDYFYAQIDQLAKVDSHGSLFGVPFGVKDIFNTKVFPTEMGSLAWKGFHAGNDARSVAELRQAGGIVAGKTDTAELAVHCPGKVLNPWDVSRHAGTSSGGSAVAVATASVPFALATQTAGSIIRPSSWCGVYGMKPSFGLIPRTGVLKTTDTLDNIGFMARSVADLTLVLDSLRVKGENYPNVMAGLDRFKARKPPVKPRLGVVVDCFPGGLDSYVKKSISTWLSELDGTNSVDLVFTRLPHDSGTYFDLHRRLYHSCLAYYFRWEYENKPHLLSETFKSLVEDGHSIDPSDYKLALKEQDQLADDLDQFMVNSKLDFLLTASSADAAGLVEEEEYTQDLNIYWTLARIPVLNIPVFYTNQGLPFGLSLVGRRYSDYKLLAQAQKFVELGLFPAISKILD